MRLEHIETYPQPIHRLTRLPDGRLIGTAVGYVGRFLFDPKTSQTTALGRNEGLSTYTHLVYGDTLYASGYWEGALFVFDPQRPWTLYKGGPPGQPAPAREDPASNPRRVGSLNQVARMTIGHSATIGADGKIHIGGFGERSYDGGSFGWYDPKTGEFGGVWKPLSGYKVPWIAPLQGGRLIVMSSSTSTDELNGNRVPQEAKLFVFDVGEQRIVREIVPVPGGRSTGPIIDITGERLLGLTADPADAGRSLLYGVNATTGEVLFREPLPWPISDRWNVWGWALDLDLVRGPDGYVWTYLEDVLVRIDPNDASVHVVGKVDPPGRPTFVGKDLYLTGSEELRRIRDIVPRPK